MPTLEIRSSLTCAIHVNGVYAGTVFSEKSITLPFSLAETVFYAIPLENDAAPVYIIIKEGRLLRSHARLNKWSEEIFELILTPPPYRKPVPPIITKEQKWNGYLGLCGEYLVHEALDGTRSFFDTPVKDFVPFGKAVLAIGEKHVIPLGAALTPIREPIPFTEYKLENNFLFLYLTPGDMDFFTVISTYDESLRLISSEIQEEKCVTDLDRIRAFCQATRLGLKDTALQFISPALKAEMDFESIKEFLGIFDQTDTPRYLSRHAENAVALRYCIDEWNFHYICYEFTLSTTTGVKLIDDITEL